VPGKVAIATSCVLAMTLAPRVLAQGESVFVTLCRVHFTVTDETGHFVHGLTRNDFTIYDNDAPQRISDFSARERTPLSVALLLDRSLSVGDRFRDATGAATTFLRSILQDSRDRALVVTFDSHVYLMQGWTSDVTSSAAGIETLSPAGGTALFDALFKTCRDAFDLADRSQRVVVLVTDGEDTTSHATFEQALQMATLSKTRVYVVGIKGEQAMSPRELSGRRVLTALADLSGGRVFYPGDQDSSHLAPVFEALQDELRNEYDASYYRESPPDGSFHRLRIVAGLRGLTIHAPTGYVGQRLR